MMKNKIYRSFEEIDNDLKNTTFRKGNRPFVTHPTSISSY